MNGNSAGTNLTRRTLLRTGLLAAGAALAGGAKSMAAEEYPASEITNGQVRAKIYLPSPNRGFYRGPRFDWSGIIGDLEYAGHRFYGPWFDRIDPPVHDFAYEGGEIVVGRTSGAMGPVEEFMTDGTALGFREAPPGGTFVKIGVGVLRKPQDGKYDRFGPMEILDHGKWHTEAHGGQVEFVHELSDPASGYAYHYRKRLRLAPAAPRMFMEHSLKNTGRQPIHSEVYDHNFLVLDRQPPGRGLSVAFPFQVQVEQPLPAELAEVRGNRILYRKTLEGREMVATDIRGYSDRPRDYDIRVEHAKAGAGYRVRCDRPLARLGLWSIRSNVSVEPFVRMEIPPGGEFTWTYSYDYFTLPAGKR